MIHTPSPRSSSAARPRARHARLAAAGVVAVLAAAGAPSAAHAVAWTPTSVPTSLTGEAAATTNRLGAASAVAPDGTTWVAWIESVALSPSGTADTLRVARRDADGTIGRPVEVARETRPAGVTTTVLRGSGVALDAAGRPSVVWSEVAGGTTTVQVSSRSAQGAWSAPQDLGLETIGASGFESSIVVHQMADGRAAAAWHDATRIEVAILGTDGTWGAAQTAGTGVGTLTEVDLASDAEGRLTVVWVGSGNPAVLSSTRAANGTWSAPTTLDPGLTDGDRSPTEPHVAADAQGDLVATWSPQDDTLAVATRAANETTWTVQRRAVRGAVDRITPDVAFDRFGNATLVWGEGTYDEGGAETGGRIRAATRRPDGTWADPQTVHSSPAPATSGAYEAPSGPRVVVGDTGAATAVWTDKRFQSPRFARLTAASRPSLGAAWDPAVPLTTAAQGALRVPDTLNADALGDVVLPFLPLAATILPSAVEPQLLDLDLAAPKQLDWSARWLPGSLNLRTFARYLGTDPLGGVTLSAGGETPEPLDPWGYRLTQADAWKDGTTGETVVQLKGVMKQAMPSHFIDIRIVDPVVRIAPDGRSAKVVADGQGSGVMNPGATEPTVDPYVSVHLLDLDLSAAGPRRNAANGTTSWLRAPATIASVEAQRYLSYGPGTAYGAWTLTIPTALETRNVPVDPGPADPGAPAPGGPGTPAPPTPTTPTTPAAPSKPATPAETPARVKTAGTIRGSKKAKRRVRVTISRVIGTKAGTTYRVVLRKGRTIVATGTLRGRTLTLTAVNTAKTGRKASYRRIRGTYTVATPTRIGTRKPTAAQRITSTSITIR